MGYLVPSLRIRKRRRSPWCMVAITPRVGPSGRSFHGRSDLLSPDSRIYPPGWFKGTECCGRMPPPNAGYHALYALFCLHHPLLHSVLSTANEIPRQYRNEPFSLYIRRLEDFMVRERLATRTYTESEALDLAVRNLLPDRRADYRRLVERDKRTGPS